MADSISPGAHPSELDAAAALTLLQGLAQFVSDLEQPDRLVRDLGRFLRARQVLLLTLSPSEEVAVLALYPEVRCVSTTLADSALVRRLARGEEILQRRLSNDLVEDPLLRHFKADAVLATVLSAHGQEESCGLVIVPSAETPNGPPTTALIRLCAAHAAAAVARHRQEIVARAVLEHSGEGVVVALPGGELVVANEALTRLTGWSSEELLERSFYDLLDRESAAGLHRLLHARESGEHEVRLRRRDGTELPAAVSGHPVSLAGRKFVLGMIRDISERLAAREARHSDLAQYQGIFDAVTDGLVILDPEGRVVEANRAACAMHGYEREEFLTLEPRQFIHPDDHWKFQEFLNTLRAGQLFQTRAVDLRKDGSKLEVEVRGTRFLFQGSPHLLGVLHDVSERVRMEREREALEHQLHQAQKMEALGQLAGGVAHDFNNILTAILGHLDIAEACLGDNARGALNESLSLARQAAEKASGLCRQLLVFGRHRQHRAEPVEVHAAVASMERMLGRLIGEDIRIRTEVDPDCGWIHAEEGQLEQAILNLVLNARDAMPAGGVLRLQAGRCRLPEDAARFPVPAPPDTYCRIVVDDTGRGMDAATRERMFEPFFTTKPAGQGTGLGLAMVYGFVQGCGGSIHVESEPGRGTTVALLLPVADRPEAVEEVQEETLAPGGSETILLCEDQDMVRDLVARHLTRHGYQVLVAADGATALDLACSHEGPLHLLLTDVVMPHVDGPALARALRRERPELKVLFISGYTPEVVGRLGVENGDPELLPKPFRARDLLQAVRRTLETGPTPPGIQ